MQISTNVEQMTYQSHGLISPYDNIVSVGVEIECGINNSDLNTILEKFDKVDVGFDGSVYVKGYENESCELRMWSKKVRDILRFSKEVFSVAKQNSTCGNHVHISFRDMETSVALFSHKKMFDNFVKRYKKFFANDVKYIQRLKSSYCKSVYDVSKVKEQLMHDSPRSCRFYAINLNAYHEHKTIEFRILPWCANWEEYKCSLLWLLRTVDNLLSESKKFSFYENLKIEKVLFVNNFVIKKEELKICA